MLSDEKISLLTTFDKSFSLSDGKGLSILCNTKGGKWWRFRYTLHGKRYTMSLGTWPKIDGKAATALRDKYNELVANDVDPRWYKKREQMKARKVISFKDLAAEWIEVRYVNKSLMTKKKIWAQLVRYILPDIGAIPIRYIDSLLVLEALQKISATGKHETAHRLKRTCGMVFRYGVACGYCDRDVTFDLTGALKTHTTVHMPTLTNPEEIGALLYDIDHYQGSVVVQSALKMATLVFVRPTELSLAKWDCIDFAKKEWRISAEDTKMKRIHIVSLSKQTIEVLHVLSAQRSESPYVFESPKHKSQHISASSLNKALVSMGYKNRISTHGFRAMASTQLNEHGFNTDIIEKQLAHQNMGKVRASYNHAEYLKERKKMMQWWADYLDTLRNIL